MIRRRARPVVLSAALAALGASACGEHEEPSRRPLEIGRNPGVVQVTFRAPLDRLEKHGLLPFVRDQYGIG